MSDDRHVSTVMGIYEAFGRGDVPYILERLTEQVDWEYGTNEDRVPWLLSRRGRDGVRAFFGALAEHLELTKFVPRAFLAGRHAEGHAVVAALVDLEARVKVTGRSFVETDETHLWHFDGAGRIFRFRHRVDTHAHRVAFGQT